MAIEIINQDYRFMPPRIKSEIDISYRIYANYLHDLESILWILIWTLFKYQRTTTKAKSEPTQKMGLRVFSNKQLFSHNRRTEKNREACLFNKMFLSEEEWIPEYFQCLRDLAIKFKVHLFDAYCKVEENFNSEKSIKPPPEGSVHLSILDAFKECITDGFGVTPIDYCELVVILRKLLLKRAAPDEDVDEKTSKKVK